MKKLFNHTRRPKEQWNDNGQDYDWDEMYQESEEEYPEEGYYAEEGVYEEGAEYAEGAYEGDAVYEDGMVYEDGAEYAGEAYGEGAYEGGAVYAEGAEYTEEAYSEGMYGEGAVYSEGVYVEGTEYVEGAYEDGAVYEDGIVYEDGTDYAEGAYGEGTYEDGMVYEDGVVYEDGTDYAGDAYGEGTYEDGIVYEDDMYYEEGAEDRYADRNYGRNGNFFTNLWDKFLDMSGIDRIIAATGVAVLLLAVVTGTVYVSASIIDKQVSEFVSVGKQLDGIDTIGEQGLVVLTDTRIAKLAAAEAVEDDQERKDYNEADYNKDVKVSLETTSILKDLKIKFVNSDTEKLVANVPFAVTITKPDGKSEVWSDDDMDGIIYKKDIAAGKYTLAVNELTGEKYTKYTLPSSSKSVEVKKDIDYKKVNVKSEIKKESEINLSKEEVKKNEIAVESSLQDTVAWVESTTTVNTYKEISKSTIPNPATLARSGQFMRLTATNPDVSGGNGGEGGSATEPQPTDPTPVQPTASLSLSAGSASVKAGGTTTITAEVIPDGAVTAVSSDTNIATVAADGKTITITGVAAGTATITVKHPSDANVTQTCTVTVTAADSISLSKTSATIVVGGTDTITATLNDSKQIKEGDVTSNNTAIATVAVSGNTITITGKAAGSAVITVKHPDGTATAVCNVTVTAAGSISLDKKSMTLFTGKQDTITVTLDNSKTIKAENVSSSNTGIATVAVSGNTITVTGVAAGSADITVKHPDNGNLTEKCTVTVKDGGSLLKDKDGNQVYVLDGDKYREAKYSDYDDIQKDKYKVFVKGNVKYTGWQTIDGKVKFFNANGDYVTGEQVIQGAKYNFASDGSLMQGSGTMGIDVSKYNGNIDWNAVKNSGVSYVIIRVGYRGYTQGSLVDDSKFAANIKGATAAGLKVGVYFFSQAVDQVEAVEEASMVLERIKGYTISYPIFLDVEYSGSSGNKGRADSLDKNTRTAVCKAFCETIKNAGYTAGVYANKTWLNDKIDASALSSYKIWLAQYAATPTYKGRYDLWQYKSTGRVSGISGNVDMNISYLGY